MHQHPPPWLCAALDAASFLPTGRAGLWARASGGSLGLAIWRGSRGEPEGGELSVLFAPSVRLAWRPEHAQVARASAGAWRARGPSGAPPPELGEIEQAFGPIVSRFGFARAFELLADERLTLALTRGAGEALSLEWRRWPTSLSVRLTRGDAVVLEREEPALEPSERAGVLVWRAPRAVFLDRQARALEAALGAARADGGTGDRDVGAARVALDEGPAEDAEPALDPHALGIARDASEVARALGADELVGVTSDRRVAAWTCSRGGFVLARAPSDDEPLAQALVLERPSVWARVRARRDGAARSLIEAAIAREAEAQPPPDEASLTRAFDAPLARAGLTLRFVRARQGDVMLRYADPRGRRLCELTSSPRDGALAVMVASCDGEAPLALLHASGGALAPAPGVTLELATSLLPERAPRDGGDAEASPPVEHAGVEHAGVEHSGVEHAGERLAVAAAALERALATLGPAR